MNREVEVIQFTSESNQIHVQLPKTDSNLDIMINIIQGMKQNNGEGIKQNIKANALHNTLNDNDQGIALNNTIKQLNNEIIKEDSGLEKQVRELVDDIQLQKDANEVPTSIQSEPVETNKPIQGPDKPLTRPSKDLDKSLTKDKKEKKKESSGKKKGFPYVLSDDQILVKNMDTDTRSISVYKPVVDHLFRNLGNTFASKDIGNCIFSSFRDDLKRKIKKSSARTYVADYRQYLLDMGFVEQIGKNQYRFTDEGNKKRVKQVKKDNTKNIGRPGLPDPIKVEIRRLYRGGLSTQDIKEHLSRKHDLDVHRNTINRLIPKSVKKKTRKISDGELRSKYAGHKKNRIMEIRKRSIKNKHLVKSMPRKVS